ncbi:MAG: type IV secretory system conjugative DNA transfer family protein [Anaerolineaceae bacterium]|jgi:hypothetical protein|nr:type IV secretory system conjugative DNA transfer family protein [Anaerolineaceae bacterium]
MRIKYRLILLLMALALLLGVGYYSTDSFDFIIQDVWFASGLLILILSALIDQPFFSTDANVFMTGAAGLTLVLVENDSRGLIWNVLLALCCWLIFSSYLTMALRTYAPLKWVAIRETISRINRNLGKPTVIYSGFFLWGVYRQVAIGDIYHPDALFIYWGLFVVLNIPDITHAISNFLDRLLTENKKASENLGVIFSVVDPNVIDLELADDCQDLNVGDFIAFTKSDGTIIGEAVLIDKRAVSGVHLARVGVIIRHDNWDYISTHPDSVKIIHLRNSAELDLTKPISVVNNGSTFQFLKFDVSPDSKLQRGMLVYTRHKELGKIYYQITSAIVTSEAANKNNEISSVSVTAHQLGIWNEENLFFEDYPWVSSAGDLVFLETSMQEFTENIPESQMKIGQLPHSTFPVIVEVNDLITHNTAILGVTGSGKTYLALSLIGEYIRCGIKVLILDISREYYPFLSAYNPETINDKTDINVWLESDSLIGIYEYECSQNLAQSTATIIEKVFNVLRNTKLIPGKSIPARVCLVLEEAHALIPEFGQGISKNDQDYVNRTAKSILQGRKFGMGHLIITQRTANITKTILNQCNTILALRCYDQTGLDFLKNYMGSEFSQALTTLANRSAVIVGKASLSQTPVIFNIPEFPKPTGVEVSPEPIY